jgi:predicted house-cleaning NTP pyrophosphatase (Maf/HAM1 superfamily)
MDPSKFGSRHLVLASASPRRRGYLHQLGYDFEAVVPQTEEKTARGRRRRGVCLAQRAGEVGGRGG